LVTQIAIATSSLSWMAAEWIIKGKPSMVGLINGAAAGLIAISPASGYVDQTGAVVIGAVAGPLCYFFAQLKSFLGYSNALDAFGVHAIGGIIGGIAVGFFATPNISGVYGVYYGDFYTGGHQLAMQLYGIVVVFGWSAFMSLVLLFLVDKALSLKAAEPEEEDASGSGDKSVYDSIRPPNADEPNAQGVETSADQS